MRQDWLGVPAHDLHHCMPGGIAEGLPHGCCMHQNNLAAVIPFDHSVQHCFMKKAETFV
jgi:hypothetical protein